MHNRLPQHSQHQLLDSHMAQPGHHRNQHAHYNPHPQLQYGQSTPMQTPQSLKRPRSEIEMGMSMSDDGMHSMPQQTLNYGQPSTQPLLEHHHHLPDSGRPSKQMRHDEDYGSPSMNQGAPSVVGQPGMPAAALRPKGPKLKFTSEDDQLLVELKEQKALTWKQIADFFPGRSSGTLQVRYCTKLKAKTTQWTDETVQKLRTALHDYEQEKWRIVANKIGTGFTPLACREKAEEL